MNTPLPPPPMPAPPPPPSPPVYVTNQPVYVTNAKPTSTMAITSLVAGLISWVLLPWIGAIVAIITGHMARSEVRKSNGAIEGDGLALAGLILGYIQIGLTVLGIIALFLFFGGIAAIAAMSQ